ncbi:MAG: anti-sigma factor family protein [Anaerolineales bacterium]
MSFDLSTRELEQISAYLDDRLSPREKSSVESRLDSEPKFAEAGQQLERTRALLRRIPQRRFPRNFTLTPQMLGLAARPMRMRGWTSLNLVSAIAGALLIAVLIGDFSVNGLPAFGLPAAGEAEEPMALMAAEAATEEAITEEPPADLASPGAEDTAGERQMKEVAPFDWRLFFSQYARSIELILAAVLLGSLGVAWQQRRSRNL